jgi:CoA:oxalate CoA-transferase
MSPSALADPRLLAGITVVDVTRVLAGPFCTLTLAHLGARVVKVEQPGVGDLARMIPPFVNGKSVYFSAINYEKESIALDLKVAADRSVFERLLDHADVLVENFRPGTLARLGYAWESLHARWPRLVYGAVSGFGHTGPASPRPAFDMVVQGMSGMMSVTGHPSHPPTRVGVSIGDLAAGLYLAIGISAALFKRAQTGQGVMLDVAMLDCQIALLAEPLSRYLGTGEMPGPMGSQHPNIAPFASYEARDGWLVIAAPTPAQWDALCRALGRPDLRSDPRFETMPDRLANLDALRAEIESALAARPAAAWLQILEAAEVPCAPVNDLGAAAAHPQVKARRMIAEMQDQTIGRFRAPGNPIKVSAVDDPTVRRAAPDLDADREAVARLAGRE